MGDELAVLGGGVTGLAIGMASDAVVYEAAADPGGICTSYHVRPDGERRRTAPDDGGAYRFEIGGGHWIFGGDPEVLALLEAMAPMREHVRRAEVHFAATGQTVAYPFQDHAADLDPALAAAAAAEQAPDGPGRPDATMADWLEARFGPSLCARFFHPFHDRYTAGLHREIAPQDAYKSPKGAAGYNVTFRYPLTGLDALTREMAARADVRFGREVTAIDTAARTLAFADGTRATYGALASTLPLDVTLRLCGIDHDLLGPPDPCTSVLVVNVGATRGPRCTDAHWVYEPESRAGFHRYGIYSNVDPSFVPHGDPGRVAIYVEHAARRGARPGPPSERATVEATVRELVERGVVGEVEVVDVSWVDAAYTWTRPGSTWAADAIDLLRRRGVHQVGRYARWRFQGIAESVAEGLAAGRSLAASAS